MKAAHKIVSSYPYTEKISDEFVASFIAVLAEFPAWVSEILAHPVHGLTGKCKFLPTIADAVEMAKSLIEREREIEHQRQRPNPREGKIAVPLGAYRGRAGKYNPFPKLTEAFADEPELLKHQSFDTLFMGSRSLAIQGTEAARQVLADVRRRIDRGWCFTPKVPSFDLAEFPPAIPVEEKAA